MSGDVSGQDPGDSRNEVSGYIDGNLIQARTVHMYTGPGQVTPHELPPAPPRFVNRHQEQANLRVLAEPDEERQRPLVVCVTGLGGIGKTALAVYCGHLAEHLYPDGTLYADLDDYRHRGTVSAGDVLGAFLGSLGYGGDWLPAGVEERAKRFRSVTYGMRVLVVLDNAAGDAEVLRLLPSSPRSAVIIASRRELDEVIYRSDVFLSLGRLSAEHGEELLVAAAGLARVSAEPEASAALVEVCDGMPIAYELVCAQLRKRPSMRISRLVRDLRARMPDGSLVDTVAGASYRELSERTRRLYRLLAVHTGPSFDVGAAAALGDSAPDEAERLLDELAGAHLIAADEDRVVFRFMRLIREHAEELSRTEESPEEREAAARRLVGEYLRVAQHAESEGLPADRLRLAPVPEGENPFESRKQALAWLDVERHNLLAAQRLAAAHGWKEWVWQFGEALWPLWTSRSHYADWWDSATMAVTAAAGLGDRRAEARMRSQLGRWHLEQGEFGKAEVEMTRGVELARDTDDRRLQASTVEFLGRLRSRQGRHEDAIAVYERALEIGVELKDERAVAMNRHFLGQAHLALGRPADALDALRMARPVFARREDERDLAKVDTDLGRIHSRLGEWSEAEAAFRRALDIVVRDGVTYQEAVTRREYAAMLVKRDDLTTALAQLERVRDIYAEVHHPALADVERELSEVRG